MLDAVTQPALWASATNAEKIWVVIRLALFFIIFVCFSITVGALNTTKGNLGDNKECLYQDDFTPCPLTLYETSNYDMRCTFGTSSVPGFCPGFCGAEVPVTPCTYVTVVSAVSIILGLGGVVFIGLFIADKPITASNQSIVELVVESLMTIFSLAAASVATARYSGTCEAIEGKDAVGVFAQSSDCDTRFERVASGVPYPGYDGFLDNLALVRNSAWIGWLGWLLLLIIAAIRVNNLKARGASYSSHTNVQVTKTVTKTKVVKKGASHAV